MTTSLMHLDFASTFLYHWVMHTTPGSLLERLRKPGQEKAWNSFVELYTPLLYYWARSQGLEEADAADLVQEVLLLLLRKLPQFEYNRDGSFRSWLRTVLLNKWRELQRRKTPQGGADQLDIIPADSHSGLEETEYRKHLVHHMLSLLKDQFQPHTWQIFEDYVLKEMPPQEVAAKWEVTLGVVYGAKSKVLSRLRQELDGLID